MNMKKTVFFIAKTGISPFLIEVTVSSGLKTIAEAGTIKSASFIVSRLKSMQTLIDKLCYYVIKFLC